MLRTLLQRAKKQRAQEARAAGAGWLSWLAGRARALQYVVAVAMLLAVAGMSNRTGPELKAAAATQDDEKRPAAPSLDGAITWLNTDNPIKLEDLRGRIVLLDFWTLCCINCIHTLPDLAKLEAKYPGILVVLGIHTPKFPNEANTDSIRKAILRYEIKHPVANDA